MGVIGRWFEDEYSPEFGSVVIRDGVFGGAVDGGLRESALLEEFAGPLWGTVARAGAGWLQLNATDEYQRVLIEAHDSAPAPETEPWGDVLETPYLSGTGAVGFSTTTSGPAQSGIRLGEPGHYRVRVCRRPAQDQGYDWVVRFWPAPPQPPTWIARDADDAFRNGLADDIYALASWAPEGRVATTVTGLARTLLAGKSDVRAALRGSQNLAVSGMRRLIVRAVPDNDNDNEAEPTPVAAVDGPPPRPGYITGTEIAANERIFGLIWPWPHRPADAGPPPDDLTGITSSGSIHFGGRPAEAPRIRPPAGAPPRLGYIRGTEIVVVRDGRAVTIGHTTLPYLDWAVETAAGVLVKGGVLTRTSTRDTRTEFVRWDGTTEPFVSDPYSIAISRDGTTAAVHEVRGGRRPWSALHLVDLHGGRRHTLELPDVDYERHLTGVDHRSIWLASRYAPVDLSWTVGAPVLVPAPGPPPACGWDGPDAPLHRRYPTAGAGASPDADRHGVRVGFRNFALPVDVAFSHPLASWEDPGHVLVAVQDTVFRLDVTAGTYETAATGLYITCFVEAWPHKPAG